MLVETRPLAPAHRPNKPRVTDPFAAAEAALEEITKLARLVWRIDPARSDGERVLLQREAIDGGIRRQVAIVRRALRR